MRKLIVVLASLSLGACGAGQAIQVEYRPVPYPVRAACPDPAVYEELRSTRPQPLAEQPMPETAAERGARITAQLGRYEAPGGWGDQAMAALDRCQQAEPLDRPADPP